MATIHCIPLSDATASATEEPRRGFLVEYVVTCNCHAGWTARLEISDFDLQNPHVLTEQVRRAHEAAFPGFTGVEPGAERCMECGLAAPATWAGWWYFTVPGDRTLCSACHEREHPYGHGPDPREADSAAQRRAFALVRSILTHPEIRPKQGDTAGDVLSRLERCLAEWMK